MRRWITIVVAVTAMGVALPATTAGDTDLGCPKGWTLTPGTPNVFPDINGDGSFCWRGTNANNPNGGAYVDNRVAPDLP